MRNYHRHIFDKTLPIEKGKRKEVGENKAILDSVI